MTKAILILIIEQYLNPVLSRLLERAGFFFYLQEKPVLQSCNIFRSVCVIE